MTSASKQRPLFDDLPDHAMEPDHRDLAIDKVGIKDLSYPIKVLDRSEGFQSTIANVSLYVGLPKNFKGTHMSRFLEILNEYRGEMTIRSLPTILQDVQQRLGAIDVHLELSFPYFIPKRAPVSGAESLMGYQCAFKASRHGNAADFVLSVQVPVTSLCPCSRDISDRGAHNQRSTVGVELRSLAFVWIEDVVEAVEGVASAPVYALLKRVDEKHLTEAAYDNPKFVEDLVRDVVLALAELPGVCWMRVFAENQESIHNHSAYAEIDWTSDHLPVEVGAGCASPRAAAGPEWQDFGDWFRTHRQARGMSQQILGDLLGLSRSYLSRVESGRNNLSEATLHKLASVLDLDPTEVLLRAGVVPGDLLQAIVVNPQGFREWAQAEEETRQMKV